MMSWLLWPSLERFPTTVVGMFGWGLNNQCVSLLIPRTGSSKNNGTAGLPLFSLPPPSVTPPLSIYTICPLHIIMLTPKIPCHGCGRSFALRSLAQHVNKTHDPCCWSVLKTSQPQVASSSIQETENPPPLKPNGVDPISKDGECSGASGHGYKSENMEGALLQHMLHLAGYQPYPQLQRISEIWTTILLNNLTLPISSMPMR